MRKIIAEILTVGTEVLLGGIVNTNAAFLSRELAGLGIGVYRQVTVGDNHSRLIAALGRAFESADTVITIGGLGPTQDDITKGAAAEYFGLDLGLHEESLRRIKKRFAGRALPENAERNALVPEGARILPNDYGSAPGVCIEKDGKTLVLLPGPPHEMEPMFINHAIPFLREKTHGTFLSRTLKIIGLGETKVENLLKDLIVLQTNPTIAPYAKVGEVHIRLTASAENPESARALIDPLADEIYSRLGANIYGEDNTTLAEAVINLLKARNQTLAIAESCTGGLIASELVSVPGSSKVLREGLITYANESKIARLGVDKSLIETYGAVSEQVAAAMAEGVAKTSGASASGTGGASIGLSITGIAGPDGGTPQKPVGLVYIGLHIAEGKLAGETRTAAHNLTGGRNEIRTRAAKLALNMLRNC